MPEEQFQGIPYFRFFALGDFLPAPGIGNVTANNVVIRNHAQIISTYFKHLSVQEVSIFKVSTEGKGVLLSSVIEHFTPFICVFILYAS